MAQYTTKRKYTKKPTVKVKRVVKKVKKETVEPVEPVTVVQPTTVPVVKSVWQKTVNWFKGLIS